MFLEDRIYSSDKSIYIKKSLQQNGGTGLFAGKQFSPPKKKTALSLRKRSGDRIQEYGGIVRLYSSSPMSKLVIEYAVELKKGVSYIDASIEKISNLSRFVNRNITNEETSNCHLSPYKNKIYLFATKLIKKDEEIICRYNRRHIIDGTGGECLT